MPTNSSPSHSSHRARLLAERALRMRHAQTRTEALLWARLSRSRLGVRFVRQAVLGDFIVDFLAVSARLIVEVDGGYHADRVRGDARRDRVLARLGYRVLRIEAALVVGDIDAAVALVVAALVAA